MKTKTKKKKIVLSALVATALALPISMLTVTKINSTQDTYAANVPSGFNDQNLYNCVLTEFQTEFPNESVASTGLTDAQLAKIKTVYCPGSDDSKIADATGIEKMTAVTGITLYGNNLKRIDVSHNPNLIVLALNENQITSLNVSNNPELMNLRVYDNQLSSLDVTNNPKLEILLAHNNPLTSIDITNNLNLTNQFTVNDILVKANIEPIATTTKPIYSLANLNILSAQQSIENTSNYTFDPNNNSLAVSNYVGAGGYAQVSSSATGRTYKLQMPKFLELNANGGANGPSAARCYSELASGACSVTIPQEEPTKSGHEFKGYANSSDAKDADYAVGESISLSEPKIVYAVWAEANTDSGSDEEAEDIDVPNTSGKTPNTGGNTKKDENNTSNLIYALPVLAIFTIIALCTYYKVKSHRKFKW